jgi:hypothetical protein
MATRSKASTTIKLDVSPLSRLNFGGLWAAEHESVSLGQLIGKGDEGVFEGKFTHSPVQWVFFEPGERAVVA